MMNRWTYKLFHFKFILRNMYMYTLLEYFKFIKTVMISLTIIVDVQYSENLLNKK